METLKTIMVGDDDNKKPKHVLRLPFAGIENAYIILSFKFQTISKAHIDLYTKYHEENYPTDPLMTFFYAGEKVGAEWEPNYGPIMTYTKCGPDWRGKTFHGTELKPKEHWFYELVEDNALAWSQMAVDEERLKPKLKAADFKGIFGTLKRWTERD